MLKQKAVYVAATATFLAMGISQLGRSELNRYTHFSLIDLMVVYHSALQGDEI